ncbi:transcriptional regulator with HTH domain and aminotransferase domain [Halobacteroides halobius DSM 5150]|uniref:Transcriptional regulator with HTH domain and aminotransferase domain n=1 Tax=Halobacteroides halobius (strain ATCC 35273 / DSM 5150 / MD-1) TaxID=748449 RepID=L0KB26_HALHC|nr:PLP-dependent aminotransferase family protein [Halobacteroides halobius]AGB41579.1 transcriptional regulator with HTH domain and aminotransferase domain [Halobacteroides halobius DSM 5150]
MLKDIQLDKSSSIYLYLQLYNQVRDLIKAGKLSPNTKLPPIRKLAKQLGVNNVTVVKGYDLLEEEELIYKKVGRGTFVAPAKKIKIEAEAADLDQQIYIDEDTKLDRAGEINFATAAPTPDLFPIAPFKKLLNKVLERDRGYAFGYQKSQGYLPLRESISNYANRYNISANPEEIQIVSGAQQGIDILAKTFLDYGDTVFVERPTYPGAISVFKSRQANIVEIPLKEDGIDITYLEAKLKEIKPKFLYLMPNFQNPTGYSYSQTKKEKLIKLADQHDLLIIEDDCLSDLNYSDQESNALKSLDKADRVIYIKSFSKIFMPGLRLAFLIIPDCYFNDILLSKYMSDIFTDGLVQRVLDLYFKEEVWEEQLIRLKETYQVRYESMIVALREYLPNQIEFAKPNGGLNIWLELPRGISASKIKDKSLKKGVNIAPGAAFYSNQPQVNKIRLSIAAVNKQEIKEGVKRLGALLQQKLNDKEDDTWDNSVLPLV